MSTHDALLAWRGPLAVGFFLSEFITRAALSRRLLREAMRLGIGLDVGALKLLQRLAKPRYVLLGACQQRGACCTQIVGNPPAAIRRRPRLMAAFATFHRLLHNFHVVAKTPDNALIFRCGYLQTDGRCGIYRWRPRLCRVYPLLPFFAPPQLLPGCGYRTALRGLKAHPRLRILGGGHVGVHHPTPPRRLGGELELPEDYILVDRHGGL